MAMLQSLSSRLPVAGRSLANSVAQAVVARVPCVAVVPSVFRAPPQRFLSSQRVYAKAPGAPARAPPPPPPPPPADDEEDEGEFEGDPLADLNAAARRRVEALREVQKKYDGINVEYQKELALLQAKYLELWAPVFDERRDIVAGTKPVEAFGIEEDGAKDEGVPDFWLNAFYNHPNISPYVNERDADVLRELLDVRASVLTGDRKGFKLSFFFRPNKFFKNTVLEKEYELEMEDEIVPKRFTGTKIEWNPGMDVTVELVKKRVKAPKGAKGAAGAPKAFVTEEVPCDSFFNIFDPPEVPNEENASRLSDEELTELQTELTEDFDIGFALKDQVIARALEWFTGEIAPLEDGEFDEYGDQGYDEQEEEPEAPPPPPPRGGGNKGGRK